MPAANAAPATGQRLTDRQYLNVVADLFGVDASADVVSLPLDPEHEGFRNAASALLPSDVRIEGYATLAGDGDRQGSTGPASWRADGVCTDYGDRCQRDFLATLGRRLFRRPLSDDQQRRFQHAVRRGPEGGRAVRRRRRPGGRRPCCSRRSSCTAWNGAGRPDDWTLATRLAFLLWNSAPDDRLLAGGRAPGSCRAPACGPRSTRMLGDARARRALRDYVDDWLDAERLLRTSRDTDRFPQWTGALAAEMREEIHRLFDDAVGLAGRTALALARRCCSRGLLRASGAS